MVRMVVAASPDALVVALEAALVEYLHVGEPAEVHYCALASGRADSHSVLLVWRQPR